MRVVVIMERIHPGRPMANYDDIVTTDWDLSPALKYYTGRAVYPQHQSLRIFQYVGENPNKVMVQRLTALVRNFLKLLCHNSIGYIIVTNAESLSYFAQIYHYARIEFIKMFLFLKISTKYLIHHV